MLLSRVEMTYDFEGAVFSLDEDRELLSWIFNQFLYGEVTGIQCGHWLYNAPDLDAARFLAKQALEEFQHIDNFLQCLAFLGSEPGTPHGLVQFLTTGMMPHSWHEHVCQEMAMGEGFVLVAMYALIDTIDHPEIRTILERAVKQEERHVAFGEERTAALVQRRPGLSRQLMGLNLVSFWGMRRLAKKLAKKTRPDHPILSHMPHFLERVIESGEHRLIRMGLIDRPVSQVSRIKKTLWVLEVYGRKMAHALTTPLRWLPGIGTRRRLTDSYLDDPSVRAAWLAAKDRSRAA